MQQILWIGLIQSLFAGIMISVKKPRHLSYQFLGAWLFLVSIEIGIELVKQYYLEFLPHKFPFRFISFTYGPLLFFYTKSLITEKFELKFNDAFHFIPFIVFFLLSVMIKEDPGIETMSEFISTKKLLPLRIFYGLSIWVSITLYSILVFVMIDRHRKNIKNQLSFTSDKVTLSWLMMISITFYVSYNITFFIGGFQIMKIFIGLPPEIFSYSGLMVLAYAYTLFGLQQPKIFEMNHVTNGIKSGQVPNKYSTSSLTEKEMSSCIKGLKSLLEKDKLFLKNDLSLADVARELQIPKHHITQAINIGLEKNFYTLINEHRVEEVIARFKDPQNKNLTLLAIAIDSGFNSKSSFNSIFKKITGYTPSEYQKSLTE